MGLPLYLAITAAELQQCQCLPKHPAWMACHFSPYSTGITNLPPRLPEGALLILNDRTPAHMHDPQTVASQLCQAVTDSGAAAVLLDLQRPDNENTAGIVEAITGTLSCPVAVTACYASDSCPVFLPPPPPDMFLEKYLQPWRGREIWLEAERTCLRFTVTEQGCSVEQAQIPLQVEHCHLDEALHCRYTIEPAREQVRFTLWRDDVCLAALWEEAAGLGVTRCVGLYQEGWPLTVDN